MGVCLRNIQCHSQNLVNQYRGGIWLRAGDTFPRQHDPIRCYHKVVALPLPTTAESSFLGILWCTGGRGRGDLDESSMFSRILRCEVWAGSEGCWSLGLSWSALKVGLAETPGAVAAISDSENVKPTPESNSGKNTDFPNQETDVTR